MRTWRCLALVAVALLALALVGCGGREVSSTAEALVGHWTVEGGKTDFYFADDGSFTRVDAARTSPGKWSVVGDEEGLAVIVELDYEPEVEPIRDAILKLTFEPGYESLATGDPDVIKGISLIWEYSGETTTAP
jgi:hypothetical protein